MKSVVRHSTAMFMALVMFASLFFGVNVSVEAANVEYVTAGDYILNWGERGETATFLSQNAEAFYEENNTSYDALASLAGGNTVNSVPASALYEELQDLMTENHTHETSYDETKNLYQYTDCQDSGKTSAAISSFYSGTAIGPEWGSTPTWNREHTWPNSKGLNGNDENDIMMLRPTAQSENSSRGNTAYGESAGYYDPNGVSNGQYDLRGDVARIVLYTYVRWGNVDNMWGTSGVIENEVVLLEWMEADPVDTWELGRNDAVESITGTRNVFVDYPELAFILFGKSVPVNYETPSGNAPDEEVVGTPMTVSFSQLGTVVAAKTVYSGQTITLPAHTGAVKEGYTFLGWVTSELSDTTVAPQIHLEGSRYAVTDNATLYAVYSRTEEGGTSTSNTFEPYTGVLTEGEYLIVSENAALTAEDTGKTRLVATTIEYAGDSINTTNAKIIWKLEKDGDIWTIYNEAEGKYVASNGTKNKATLVDSATDNAKWTLSGESTYDFTNVVHAAENKNATLRKNQTYGFACYSTATGSPLYLYKRAGAAEIYFTSDGNRDTTDTVAPTVTGVADGETYLTTQKVTVIGDDIATVTVNGEVKDTTFTLEGNKSVIYTIVATDTNGNSTTVIVNMRPVAVVANSIKDITVDNVKATDKADIEAVLAEVTALLADEDLSEAEEAELNAIKVNAEALLKKIEDDAKVPEITPPGDEDSDDETSDDETSDDETSDDEEEVTPPGTDDGPDTGDHNINLLWYTMLFMGGAGLVALRISEHKEKMTFK